MKHILFGIISGFLLLTACGQAPSAIQATPISVIDISTRTSSPSPSNTITSIPTETPMPSTTPLPTIPTFTPTFDALTIVTVTPAEKAECPKIDSTIKVEDYLPGNLNYPSPSTTTKILDFLNKGGDGQELISKLKQIYPYGGEYRGGYAFRDVTGDQVFDFLYVEINYEGKPVVFSCKNERFELLDTLSGEHDSWDYTLEIDDLIADGIPEIIVTGTDGVSFPQSKIYIFEWNGKNFTILGTTSMSALWGIETIDLDSNGIKEIIFTGDNPTCVSCSNFIPQRQRTVLFSWNGKEFVETSNEFESPEYRFQAVQDADIMVVIGNYGKAIQLYDEAISNNKLDWWSPERFTYEQHIGDPVTIFVETPSTIPTIDFTEYPRLAAYAYYRIMLLHFVQGNETEATSTYQTLQQKFGNDSYGQPYVEMATVFWETYRSSQNMYDSCAAAIQYAVEHPEILTPLGSDYHGSQSHIYVLEDVCPFR